MGDIEFRQSITMYKIIANNEDATFTANLAFTFEPDDVIVRQWGTMDFLEPIFVKTNMIDNCIDNILLSCTPTANVGAAPITVGSGISNTIFKFKRNFLHSGISFQICKIDGATGDMVLVTPATVPADSGTVYFNLEFVRYRREETKRKMDMIA